MSSSLLITRAPERVQMLTRRAAQLGWETIACETVSIEPAADDKTLVQRIQALPNADIFIFVSQNAATFFFRHMNGHPDNVITLAVGPATERVLAEYGVPLTHPPVPPYNSESLLALPVLQSVRAREVVIVAGEGGRDRLEKELTLRGARVTKLELYRRLCPTRDLSTVLPDWKARVTLVIGTSAASVNNLLTLAGREASVWLRSLPLIVVSERLAKLAREQMGFRGRVVVANDASEEGLAQSVASYILRFQSCNKDAS